MHNFLRSSLYIALLCGFVFTGLPSHAQTTVTVKTDIGYPQADIACQPAGQSGQARSCSVRRTVYPNNSVIDLKVVDINPYAYQCSVSSRTTVFKETAIASFLSLLQVPAGTAATMKANAVLASPEWAYASIIHLDDETQVKKGPSAQACPTARADIQATSHAIATIETAVETYRKQLMQSAETFNTAYYGLRNRSGAGLQAAAIEASWPVPMGEPQIDLSPLHPGMTVSLSKAIDILRSDAAARVADLQKLSGGCKDAYGAAGGNYDGDLAGLSAFAHGSSGSTAIADDWLTEIKQLNSAGTNIEAAGDAMRAIANQPENFSILQQVSGQQEEIDYTISCKAAPDVHVTPDLSPVAAAVTPAATSPKAAAGGAGAAANSLTLPFSFGQGPRFVLGGGIVISPLPQQTFSTVSNTGGTNTIVEQNSSSTRLLPIAVLHGRIADFDIKTSDFSWTSFLPNYFSAGVTAKGDDKGTAVEYLFGPSWSFIDNNLFITAGAYAGQQQRLLDNLAVGSTTSLSAANLPISKDYHWKAGFALTWAVPKASK